MHSVMTFGKKCCISEGCLPQGALGGHKRSDDRAMARDIAGDVCMADLLEFQRLTEQFEELRQWLLA